MKSLFDFLGLSPPAGASETTSVPRIVAALEELPPEKARFTACFAFLLGRVAHADLHISDAEKKKMAEIVARDGHLPPEQASLVVEIASSENEAFGSSRGFQVAREFRSISSRDQRRDLMHCLFAVSIADHEISGNEEKQLRNIAEELGFSHREYIEVRSDYNEHRSVVKRLKQ